jgi:serine/threonine protein kinase
VIANRYQPLEAAPAGAAVKARDLQTAQTVMLRPVTRLDERLCGVFHPSLVTIFDVVQDGTRTFAACEFVQGRSLRLIMGGQPFNSRRAAEIVVEVADAVAELHARGIYHGAISVDTVLLTAKGKSKLDLVHVIDANESADVDQLRGLLRDLTHLRPGDGGQAGPLPDLAAVTSAAVLAATLRA